MRSSETPPVETPPVETAPVETPSAETRRALILDFDGVLVDSEPLHHECWRRAFEQRLGRPAGNSPGGEIGLSLDAILDRWGAALGVQLDAAEKEALLAHKTELFYTLGADRLRPMPGSLALIRRARALGWYVAVVSRARRLRLHGTLEIMQMPALFDLVLGCEDGVNPLTDRKEHDRAAHVFAIDPACCVVVEDSASGVADARAAGIGWVIGLTTSLPAQALYAAGAHQVVDSLDTVELAP